ncbi:hypothetical protein TPA0910_62810 [Streptomyces hygroscopicus subsp. sporocinereus]|uniref:Uncharacterized protein n=1 Tax=Streptomyces hygroscopicus TaxID=1912 RepID=A0ABQ3U8A7_STRHY|nr:hypothetical protein TPA0910_62810 [Streptomyces hygroscopicus]
MAETQLPSLALSAVCDDGGPARGILRRQALRQPAARTYVWALPIVPARARGRTVEGTGGRRCPDGISAAGAGAGALTLRHNHPVGAS